MPSASLLQHKVRAGFGDLWRSVASDLLKGQKAKQEPDLKLAAGVTLKYTYPEDIPEHKPLPKKKQVYDDCSDSDSDV